VNRRFDDNAAVWLAGAADDTPAPPLSRDITVDVAIIGGGFTGVSSAYHLSRRFPKLGIALVEAKRLGNGASGRNGGMMLNGISLTGDIDEIAREYAVTTDAMDGLETLIRDEKLRVRYRRDGCFMVLTTQASADAAHAEAEALAARGIPLRFFRPDELGDRLHARGIAGAVLDPGEGILNGVDLIRAMRPLLAGVQIYESTVVTRVREAKVIELETTGGTIRANAIVLATNGYTPRLGYFSSGILPVISHVVATDPLPRETIARGFGTVAGFSDDLPRLAYAGIDPEGRLVFGGGTNAAYGYRVGNATTFAARLGDAPTGALRSSLARYFPELADIELRHRWSGPLGLTLARHCAMGVRGAHRNVYYALGYSGHGVVLANLAGRVIADLYAGHHDPWRNCPFYMKSPSGIPPEPMRWIGYHVYTKLTGRSPWKRPTRS
jgi:glycine/D-amino acid oxidase-like deaminating enzyme